MCADRNIMPRPSWHMWSTFVVLTRRFVPHEKPMTSLAKQNMMRTPSPAMQCCRPPLTRKNAMHPLWFTIASVRDRLLKRIIRHTMSVGISAPRRVPTNACIVSICTLTTRSMLLSTIYLWTIMRGRRLERARIRR